MEALTATGDTGQSGNLGMSPAVTSVSSLGEQASSRS